MKKLTSMLVCMSFFLITSTVYGGDQVTIQQDKQKETSFAETAAGSQKAPGEAEAREKGESAEPKKRRLKSYKDDGGGSATYGGTFRIRAGSMSGR